jgi:hypothetical protein
MRMRGDTRPRLHAPHLRLRVVRPRKQVLARIAPVETQHPAAVAREVGHLLARRDVVEGDDAGVAAGCEQFGGRREGDAADGVDEPGEGVGEAPGFVVEDVD